MEESQVRSSTYDPKIENVAQQAHQSVDRAADKALTGVGKVSDSMHRALNTTIPPRQPRTGPARCPRRPSAPKAR